MGNEGIGVVVNNKVVVRKSRDEVILSMKAKGERIDYAGFIDKLKKKLAI